MYSPRVHFIRKEFTAMSLYGNYDNFYSTNPSPAQLGGQHRASTGIRDQHGRFMPNDEQAFETWTLDPDHGVKGGKIRAATAKRVSGRFA
jgi:hypothetical protein